MSAWQIDALDPRGGIAFASWRNFSLSDEGDHFSDAPCVLITAPFFQPEPIATRVLAMTAHHGSFQVGLFVGSEEVRFATLDAVAEFVRRVYLRGGGGDGVDGGAAPVPPRPDEGGPDLAPVPGDLPEGEPESREPASPQPRAPATGRADALKLVDEFERSAEAEPVHAGAPIHGKPFEWSPKHGPSETRGLGEGSLSWPAPVVGGLRHPADVLGRAALILIRELLLRLPAARLVTEERRWERAAQLLGHLLSRLGLWSWLLGPKGLPTLRLWAESLRNSASWPTDLRLVHELPDPIWIPAAYWRLFGAAPAIEDEDWFRWIDLRWRYFEFDVNLPFGASASIDGASDPLDALRFVPLPPEVARAVSVPSRKDVGLLHLLTAAIASPEKLFEDGKGGNDAMTLLIFAACTIVLNEPQIGSSFRSFRHSGTSLSRVEMQRIDELTGKAWEWLVASLPRLAFPQSLEALIASASALRYRNGAPEDGTTPEPTGPPSPQDGGNHGQPRAPEPRPRRRAAGA